MPEKCGHAYVALKRSERALKRRKREGAERAVAKRREERLATSLEAARRSAARKAKAEARRNEKREKLLRERKCLPQREKRRMIPPLPLWKLISSGETPHQKKRWLVSPPPSNPVSTVSVRPSAATLIRFDQLTKEAAAVQILEEFGKAMPAPAIFMAMKARGHPVMSANALRSLLQKSSKFINTDGLWSLAPKAHL